MVRPLTITTQESGARLCEPGKTLKKGQKIAIKSRYSNKIVFFEYND